jgi:hypothetical protein
VVPLFLKKKTEEYRTANVDERNFARRDVVSFLQKNTTPSQITQPLNEKNPLASTNRNERIFQKKTKKLNEQRRHFFK